MPQFEITKIVNYLNQYKNQLDELYDWKPRFEKLLEIGVVNEIELRELNGNGLSNFQKDEKLKSILSNALNKYEIHSHKFADIALWIIRDWGGIKTGKDTMTEVFDYLATDRPKFNRIASTSKVGAFMTPTERIIYDSRVAYTMNWIILSQNAGDKFFPIPEGRNSKMHAFNLNVLIRLQFSHIYHPNDAAAWKDKRYISNRDKEIYIPKADAYYELNKLVGEVNQYLWDDTRKHEPFYAEMLLFSIADKDVFREITEHVSIDIEEF